MSTLSRRTGATRRAFLTTLGAVTLTSVAATTAKAEPPALLRMFSRSKSTPKPDSLMLTQEDGPWLILATTLVGENSRARAERTANEIREAINLPTFIYKEDFNFTGDAGGAKQAGYRNRYANPHSYQAYAVLVGEYDTVQHPSIDRDLTSLKKADLPIFRDQNEVDAEYNVRTPINTIKTWSQRVFQSEHGRTKSPLAGAFVTRNPLLKDSYFQNPTVDSFVQQLNEGVPYSLLECDGKFTVIVKTFEGFGSIVNGKLDKEFEPSARRMDKFATDANRMVRKLRADGEEAYQYHDRQRSVVTIGSFESLGQELPGGGFRYSPEIQYVMRRFGALSGKMARTVPGRSGVAANHVAMIPFDVQPTPMAVPKPSKKSIYAAAFRR